MTARCCKAFKSEGMRVQGIDPARNIAAGATEDGMPTIPDFFTSQLAAQIKAEQDSAACSAPTTSSPISTTCPMS